MRHYIGCAPGDPLRLHERHLSPEEGADRLLVALIGDHHQSVAETYDRLWSRHLHLPGVVVHNAGDHDVVLLQHRLGLIDALAVHPGVAHLEGVDHCIAMGGALSRLQLPLLALHIDPEDPLQQRHRQDHTEDRHRVAEGIADADIPDGGAADGAGSLLRRGEGGRIRHRTGEDAHQRRHGGLRHSIEDVGDDEGEKDRQEG